MAKSCSGLPPRIPINKGSVDKFKSVQSEYRLASTGYQTKKDKDSINSTVNSDYGNKTKRPDIVVDKKGGFLKFSSTQSNIFSTAKSSPKTKRKRA